MEMPFDYPGSQSDVVSTSPNHMRKITSWVHIDDDDSTVNWSIWSVPNWWTDDDMDDMIDECFPAEHCTHDYDCCGRLYARKGKWAWHPFQIDCGSRAAVISQTFIRNI